MATISEIKRKRGKTAHKVRFTLDGRRWSVTLNAAFRRADAEEVARAIEDTLDARRRGEYPSRRTRVFFETAPREILDKLARVGIGEARRCAPLGEALIEFTREHSRNVKESTRRVVESSFKAFVKTTDAARPVRNFTREDAARSMEQIREGRSSQYARNIAGHLKQFWTWTIEKGYADENVWEGVTVRGARKLPGRDFEVPSEWTAPILDACPTQAWRALFALYRFGGLRRNEALTLRWSNVHWDRNRFTVESSKTERYAGKESRVVPLFREIEEELDALFTETDERADLIFSEMSASTLEKELRAIIQDAGCNPWPRLFQNIRATRENELVAQGIPAHVVGAWLGHTNAVQSKYYLRVLDSYYDVAVGAKNENETKKGTI